MATFADYEILEELYRGPLGAVLRGRLPGQARDFAIKVFDPAMMGLLEADAATQAFLDRSALQKSMVERGAGYWSRLHELIATPEGAYYVEDYFPLTGQKLAAGRVALGGKALHHVVTSVVKGLLELRMRHRRAHGNLKPSNVLIAGTAEALAERPADVRVLLTDVATEGDGPEARAGDLRALGDLIHQLVLHRPSQSGAAAEETAWPLRQSPEWARLGRDAARWRELCGWLLTPPEASGGPRELEEVVAVLRELTPRRRRVPKRRVLALLAVPVVLLGLAIAAAVVFGRIHDTARKELAEQDSQWFGALEQALQDPARRQAFRADPDLRTVVDELDRAEAEHVPFDPAANPRLSLDGYRRTRSALERVERIRQDLAPEHWRRLRETIALQKRFEERHWDQPAAYVAKLVRGTHPAPGGDVAAGIDRFLQIQPRVGAGAAAVEPVWVRLTADLQVLDKTGDKVLLAFADYFRGAAAVLVRFNDDGADGIDDVQSLLPLADRLATVVAKGWPNGYARDPFARYVESSINTVRPQEKEIKAWLDAVDGYALVRLDERSKPLESLDAGYKNLVTEAGKQDYTPEQRAGFEAARAQLQSRLQAFRAGQFLKKDVAFSQGEVGLQWSALQREIDALRKQWVNPNGPAQWVASVDATLPTDSEELNRRWRTWVESLNKKKDALDADPAAYKATKKATEEMKAALSELDRAFPKLPGDLSPSFRDAAWKEREQELSKLSTWAVPGDALPVPPTAEQTKPAIERFGAWCAKLQALAKDFPLNREILTLADRPDLAWEKKEPQFWQHPTVQALVAPDVQRIRALAAVNQANRIELVKLAEARGNPAEVVLAVWRRLGAGADAGGITPPWPTAAGELKAEVELRGWLADLLKNVRDAAVRDAATAELKARGPEQWRRFTNAAGPDALAEAVKYRAALGVNLNEAAKLDPPVRFNLALYTARAAAGDPTPNVVRTASEELRSAAAGVKDRPGIADLLTKLGRINEPEPMANALGGKLPPTYQLPIPGSPYQVVFVRVAPRGMRPFYLATNEVSFGAFVDLVSAAGNWSDANALLGNILSAATGPGVTQFHGPQLWARPTSPAQQIGRYDTWRYDNGLEFEILDALRPGKFNRNSIDTRFGGNPGETHPMQQVSAQAALYAAALVNCRLPTAAEWAAANRAQSTPAPNDPKPNRRDATWLAQCNYARPGGPSQWPAGGLNGVFWPKTREPAGNAQPVLDANGRPYEDYTVFFRTVDTGGGTFVNLIGNVAEFTCDVSEAFEAAESRKTAADMAAFAKANASRISVIGGSAFSGPELKVDVPYQVNSPAEPYCDVGFRLAFTAPVASPAERLQVVLAEQQFLPVNTVAGK